MANKTNSSRIETLEMEVLSIKSTQEAILASLERITSMMAEPESGKKAAEKPEKSGTVKHSKNATKCAVSVVDGKGKGAGRKFIEVTFDGKPSEKVLFTLKGNDFRYFAPTKTWSAAHTEKRLKAVEALMK